MVCTPEQIVNSLFGLVDDMIESLYESKCKNTDNYNNQAQEIWEQYQSMKQ